MIEEKNNQGTNETTYEKSETAYHISLDADWLTQNIKEFNEIVEAWIPHFVRELIHKSTEQAAASPEILR